MSGEAFETDVTMDCRTAPDGRTGQQAPAYSQQPRWPEDPNGWAACHLYAETLLTIAAKAVREQPMDGISGDHPDKRAQVAAEIERAAHLVRLLALDHANDGEVTDEAWQAGLRENAPTTRVYQVQVRDERRGHPGEWGEWGGDDLFDPAHGYTEDAALAQVWWQRVHDIWSRMRGRREVRLVARDVGAVEVIRTATTGGAP